jgi:hypothetical protein
MARRKAARRRKGDIDRRKHEDDYAEHVIGGAHVSRMKVTPPARGTADDRPTKSRPKTDR